MSMTALNTSDSSGRPQRGGLEPSIVVGTDAGADDTERLVARSRALIARASEALGRAEARAGEAKAAGPNAQTLRADLIRALEQASQSLGRVMRAASGARGAPAAARRRRAHHRS